jgi:tripartite-type tricarboxylate transporter receptor subunit TctC
MPLLTFCPSTMTSRRTLLASAATAAAASFAPVAFAQAYPTKPIRVVVPFPPGGGTDIIAREVTQKIAANTGWSIVIDNKPGSGGNLGIDSVAKSPADGYNIGLGQTSNLAINPTLYGKMPYDSVKDLAPIGLVASAALVLVVGADSPLKTLADLLAAAKANPGVVNYATSGNGTVAHLSGELLQRSANIKLTHIPYKGASQAATDVIGGRVQVYISSVPTLIGQIRSGKMRALAVTSTKRVDDLPDVPTVAESGFRGFDAVTWFGFVAPTGVDKDIITRLNAELAKALQAPDVRKKLGDQGADVLGGPPDQLGKLVRDDLARWAPIIKASGAKLD